MKPLNVRKWVHSVPLYHGIHYLKTLFPDHTPQSSFSRALDSIKANNPRKLQTITPALEPLDGIPLMKIAAERGYTGCIRVLLAGGAKFNMEGSKPEETTPLHLAAKNSHKRYTFFIEWNPATLECMHRS